MGVPPTPPRGAGRRVVDAVRASSLRSRLLAGAFAVLLVAVIVVAGQLGSRAGRETPGAGGASNSPTPTPSASASACAEDGFDADSVDASWAKVQPADGGFVVAAGSLELNAKDGSDIYVEELRAPMLLREPGGNFTIETDVTAAPEQFYQGAGLLLWNGSQSYVRLERGFGDVGAIVFEYRDGGKHIKVRPPHKSSPDIIETEATHVQLQLTKNKESVSARWRPYPEKTWREIDTISIALPDHTRAGVTALNRAQDGAKPTPFTARFDYVRTCARPAPG